MTPQQQSALEALVGRTLTAPEVAQLTPLVAIGATQAIADILSAGRECMTWTGSRWTTAQAATTKAPK